MILNLQDFYDINLGFVCIETQTTSLHFFYQFVLDSVCSIELLSYYIDFNTNLDVSEAKMIRDRN
jgi:hypothetical protein